jgi:hypothetical protein
MGAGEVQPLETPGRCGCLVEMFRRLRHGLATEFLPSVSRFRICTAHSTQELVLRIQSHICGSAEVIPPTPVHLEAKLPRPGPEGTGWRREAEFGDKTTSTPTSLVDVTLSSVP